ncbi:MAG: RNA-binding transcriptional accessory protein, partial [Armatimonadetes bacterium]|nr:RNA-binding transcriptional accessory protein [Armatimonadota bacterium]
MINPDLGTPESHSTDPAPSEHHDSLETHESHEVMVLSDNDTIVQLLTEEAKAQRDNVRATLKLLEDEGAVPFVARYRKEITGNLSEAQIRVIDERRRFYSDLLHRRETIINTIGGQGLLTPELRASIEETLDRTRLEDIYLPYRPKRRTRAALAMEKGVEPLARAIYQQNEHQTIESLWAAADTYVSEERGVANRDEVLAAAQDIIAEWIADDAELRQAIRDLMVSEGAVRAQLKPPRAQASTEGAGEESVPDPRNAARAAQKAERSAQKAREREEAIARYRSYHGFRESVRAIPSHRILAIRRGAREEILTYGIEADHEKAIGLLRPHVVVEARTASGQVVEAALQDAYQRLMKPSIENEVKQMLRRKADGEAIRVFSENLESLLMAPPAGALVVLGIVPGFRTGCKVAVVDTTGTLLDHATIYPVDPRSDEKGSEKILVNLIERHRVGAIAIGNGTASRETHSFVRRLISRRGTPNIFSMVVNEAGASVYAASEEGREEFPDLDVTVRAAVSIARRLQDPLAELVKIDPRSLGIGQYQHDIDQKRLRQSLHDTVESAVNHVSVDLNSGSVALLRYVAGLDQALAEAIVKRREEVGAFRTREDLLTVSGITPRKFEQAAGFVRVRDGENALDTAGVHPESYGVVDTLAATVGTDVPTLLNNPDRLGAVDRPAFAAHNGVGVHTLADVLHELAHPNRDPREKFVIPEFREDVQKIDDLQVGMELEGTVTNVANFGAFVDIGVHQDGLVHVSELSTRFVQDPREVAKVGDIVKVR